VRDRVGREPAGGEAIHCHLRGRKRRGASFAIL
jgi:hypothetical protein